MPELRGALRAKAFKVPGRADDVRTSGPDRLAGVVVTPRVHIRVEGRVAAARKVGSFVEAEADGRLCCRAGAACGFGQPAREHAWDPCVATRSGLLRRAQPLVLQPRPRAPSRVHRRVNRMQSLVFRPATLRRANGPAHQEPGPSWRSILRKAAECQAVETLSRCLTACW